MFVFNKWLIIKNFSPPVVNIYNYCTKGVGDGGVQAGGGQV